jgi:CDP-4-dehydro-6-deoxyglucose reductase, E1
VYGEFGYNCRMTDLQAAIGCVQLTKLPRFIAARRANHAALTALTEPVADRLLRMRATVGAEPSWFGFLVTVGDGIGVTRDELVRELEARRIQTRMLFAGNIVRQPCFDGMRAEQAGYRVVGDLANTDRMMRDSFWVGVYPGLTDEVLDYIGSSICDILATATGAQ